MVYMILKLFDKYVDNTSQYLFSLFLKHIWFYNHG